MALPTDQSRPKSQRAETKSLASGLYLVATPIGNLKDLTFRAHEVLTSATVIACEDTRVSRKLLSAYGISTPTLSYHEHNAARIGPQLIKRIKNGEAVALVSDAGTPMVSDPGYRLMQDALSASLPVTTLPGPCAVIAGLCLSGLPSDRFLFAGFLPNKKGARQRALAELAAVPATLVFFESPQRIQTCLSDMAEILGNRPAAVVREITKKFEDCRRGALTELATHYLQAGPPKGELVVVVGGAAKESRSTSEKDLDQMLSEALQSHSTKDAAALVAARCGLPKRGLYERALALKTNRRKE